LVNQSAVHRSIPYYSNKLSDIDGNSDWYPIIKEEKYV